LAGLVLPALALASADWVFDRAAVTPFTSAVFVVPRSGAACTDASGVLEHIVAEIDRREGRSRS